MKTLDRNIFKLISNTISVDKFESFLYQEDVLSQIDSNKLVFDLIDINYRSSDYLHKLKNVLKDHFDKTDFLIIELCFNCLRIIEANGLDEIEAIISKYSAKYVELNFEYESIGYFYTIANHLDMIEGGYGNYTPKQIFENIKSFARKFLDEFDKEENTDKLLNLGESIPYGGDLPFFEEEIIMDFVTNKKLDFYSNKKIKENLNGIGFKDTQVEKIIDKAEKASISKFLMRISIYLVIGVPFFYVGLKAIEQKQIIGSNIFMLFAGVIMILASLIHLVQLIYLIIKRNIIKWAYR